MNHYCDLHRPCDPDCAEKGLGLLLLQAQEGLPEGREENICENWCDKSCLYRWAAVLINKLMHVGSRDLHQLRWSVILPVLALYSILSHV